MEKIIRFIAKNRYIMSMLCGIIVGCTVGALGALNDLPLGVSISIGLVFVIPVTFLITGCGPILQNRALKIMNENCDPYPFLEETRIQLSYPGNRASEILVKMNHAMALRCVGEYEQSWLILNAIHIDKYHYSPVAKAVYYNNLTDILTLLGRNEEAEVWYRKTVQVINDLPPKARKKLETARDLAIAEHFYRIGEYETALERRDAVTPANALARVENAIFRARCFLALEDRESARRELEYVIANGNRLHFVTEARSILDTI